MQIASKYSLAAHFHLFYHVFFISLKVKLFIGNNVDKMDSLLGSLDDNPNRHAIQQVNVKLVTGKKEMEKKVRDLKNVVHDINERLWDTERYLSRTA